MKLKLTQHELDYLIMIIQQNLDDDYVEDDEVYLEMISNLHIKLLKLNK